MAVHAGVDSFGFPCLAELDKDCADLAREGGFDGKQACDPGAAIEFHVQALQCGGGPDEQLMSHGEAGHNEALREVFLHPSSQLGSGGVFSSTTSLRRRRAQWRSGLLKAQRLA